MYSSSRTDCYTQDNGYVQIAPVVGERTRVGKGQARRTKPAPQNAHRLVVVAHKADEEIARLLAGQHASHLCHNTTCIAEGHIVVEPKEWNEGRKCCPGAQPTYVAVWRGEEIMLPPEGKCVCPGEKCISMIIRREAVRRSPQ